MSSTEEVLKKRKIPEYQAKQQTQSSCGFRKPTMLTDAGVSRMGTDILKNITWPERVPAARSANFLCKMLPPSPMDAPVPLSYKEEHQTTEVHASKCSRLRNSENDG